MWRYVCTEMHIEARAKTSTDAYAPLHAYHLEYLCASLGLDKKPPSKAGGFCSQLVVEILIQTLEGKKDLPQHSHFPPTRAWRGYDYGEIAPRCSKVRSTRGERTGCATTGDVRAGLPCKTLS